MISTNDGDDECVDIIGPNGEAKLDEPKWEAKLDEPNGEVKLDDEDEAKLEDELDIKVL